MSKSLNTQVGHHKNGHEKDHQESTGQNEQLANLHTLLHEDWIMVILVLLAADVVKQADLFRYIPLGREEAATVNLLVKQWITFTHDRQKCFQRTDIAGNIHDCDKKES